MKHSFPHSPSPFPFPFSPALTVIPKIISRRKRQTGSATTLTVEWLSNSNARLSWSLLSESEPPEGTYYTVAHVAVVVAGGRTATTFQSFTVPYQSTSSILRRVSESNFNIFALNTVTSSNIHALYTLTGKYVSWNVLFLWCMKSTVDHNNTFYVH